MTADLKDRHYGYCARCGITLSRHGSTACADCLATDHKYVTTILAPRKAAA